MKFKIQLLSHSNHISRAPQPPVTGSYHVEELRQKAVPSLHDILLDSAALEYFW